MKTHPVFESYQIQGTGALTQWLGGHTALTREGPSRQVQFPASPSVSSTCAHVHKHKVKNGSSFKKRFTKLKSV